MDLTSEHRKLAFKLRKETGLGIMAVVTHLSRDDWDYGSKRDIEGF